jgi:hypothetical protein
MNWWSESMAVGVVAPMADTSASGMAVTREAPCVPNRRVDGAFCGRPQTLQRAHHVITLSLLISAERDMVDQCLSLPDPVFRASPSGASRRPARVQRKHWAHFAHPPGAVVRSTLVHSAGCHKAASETTNRLRRGVCSSPCFTSRE